MMKEAKEDIMKYRDMYLDKALHWWSTTKEKINAGQEPVEEDHLLNDIIMDENDLIPKGVRGARLGVNLDKFNMESLEPLLRSYKAYDEFRSEAQRRKLKGLGHLHYGGSKTRKRRTHRK